ncbi:tetratricopeptide repeat protein [bacterium]|nr:tetratricopeptide repeat protein [bacterium]
MEQGGATNPLVVILSGQADQAVLARGTSRAGFGVVCVNTNKELSEALAKHPWGLVHNLRAFDVKQNYILQQRLARNQGISAITRFIIAPEINTPALALVADCAIRQAFNLSAALSGNLGEQLNVLRQTDNTRSEAQKIVHSQRVFQYSNPTKDYLAAVIEAYQAFPHDPIVRLEYAITRLHAGDVNDAGLLAKRLLQVEAHNVRAMNLLANVQLKAGDLDGSLRILETANKICPSNPDRLTMIGDVQVKKGNLAAAKKAYLEALDVYPPLPSARNALVQIPLSPQEVEAAVHIMRGVMSEKDRAALLNKAAIQAVNSREFPNAVRIYGYALQHLQEKEHKAAIHYNLGLAYKKMGDISSAKSSFHECLSLVPNHPNVKEHLAELDSKHVI